MKKEPTQAAPPQLEEASVSVAKRDPENPDEERISAASFLEIARPERTVADIVRSLYPLDKRTFEGWKALVATTLEGGKR